MSKSWKSRAGSLFKKRGSTADQTFDDEAHALFAQLNLEVKGGISASTNSRYNNLDAVWRHPVTGAAVYIGNESAVQSRETLESHNITHIVNCTSNIKNYFESDPKFHYLRFKVSYWFQDSKVSSSDTGALDFFEPVFQWIDDALAQGQSAIIHCLAGAHRAGTTGTLFVMHATGMDLATTLKVVKGIRPVVNPIGMLKTLAKMYDDQQQKHGVRQSIVNVTPSEDDQPKEEGKECKEETKLAERTKETDSPADSVVTGNILSYDETRSTHGSSSA